MASLNVLSVPFGLWSRDTEIAAFKSSCLLVSPQVSGFSEWDNTKLAYEGR